MDIINGFPDLLDNKKELTLRCFNQLLNTGFSSYNDKIESLLLKYNIIQEGYSVEIKNRIRFMNMIRNKLVHSGRVPDLPGKPPREHSVYYSAAIAAGVVGEICCLVLGKEFGFVFNGLGSKSQDIHDLVGFFRKGNWRGSKIDEETYEAWHERELNS